MSAPIKLSLALIAKNEARCLARCLQSIRAVADEIIVTDTGSTDDTVKIAGQFGAKISHFAWSNDFAAARNFALAQAVGDWILVLDADEWASEALAREIKMFIAGPPQIGRLKIVSDFRHHGQTQRSSTFVSRLFPRGAKFEGRIHEQIASTLPRVNLRGELWHDGYLETKKSERNVTMLQAEIAREPHNAYLHFQLALEFTSLGRPQNAFASLQKARAHMKSSDPFAPNVIVDFLYAAMELKNLTPASKPSARPKTGSPTSRTSTMSAVCSTCGSSAATRPSMFPTCRRSSKVSSAASRWARRTNTKASTVPAVFWRATTSAFSTTRSATTSAPGAVWKFPRSKAARRRRRC